MNALIKSLTLILLGLLGAIAAAELIHDAQADLAFASAKGRFEALRQVRQLDPTRADASARMGSHWMKTFPPRYDLAATSFQEAAAANPFDAYHWLDYARASLRQGKKRQAERALAMAERVDSVNSEVQLDLGNIRLEMNDLDRAAANHARAIALAPNLADQLCPFYEASGWEPRQTAERLLGNNPDLLERYFLAFLGNESTHSKTLASLWEYVSADKNAINPNTWQAYFQFLIAKREFVTAKTLWKRIARKYYGTSWDEGREPFWNGNLARPITFHGGLEWQVATAATTGYSIEIEPEQNVKNAANRLRLNFDGTANINATFVSHGLLLEPGQAYLLRCQAGAHGITTDNGPYLALNLGGEHPTTIRSRMLTESGSWNLELQFNTPQDCGWAELAIRRDLCSRLNNKIKGEVWLGGFTLEQSTATAVESGGKP